MERIRNNFEAEVSESFNEWQNLHGRRHMDEAEMIEEFAYRKYKEHESDEAACTEFIGGDQCLYSKMEQTCIDWWKETYPDVTWRGCGVVTIVNMWKYNQAVLHLRATVYEIQD